jgi:hypothetical protein
MVEVARGTGELIVTLSFSVDAPLKQLMEPGGLDAFYEIVRKSLEDELKTLEILRPPKVTEPAKT